MGGVSDPRDKPSPNQLNVVSMFSTDSSIGASSGPVEAGDLGSRAGISLPTTERFLEQALLGRGGSGEVRRHLDRVLGRLVAVKTLRPEYASMQVMVSRFVHEARVLARLQHPAIVPVYDLARFPDGRWYLLMQEVRGQDLERIIRSFHGARRNDALNGEYEGITLRRLVEHLRVVSEAVGFAHTKGVIHRDLKPENIMVGGHGEVLVVDWGLAKLVGTDDPELAVLTQNGLDLQVAPPQRTQQGVVAGTPAYMPPEQARGDQDKIGPWSDVWALGGVLYTILYGAMPYRGNTRAVLEQVKQGPPPVPPGTDAPAALVELWRHAMSMDIRARFADGAAMAREIAAWLEGSRARESARRLVREARGLHAGLQEAQRDAERSARAARSALVGLRPTDDLQTKESAWALEEEARGDADRVEALFRDVAAKCRSALAESADVTEARQLLAELYRERCASAEAAGDERAAREYMQLLAEYDDGRHADYIRSMGRVQLLSEPPEAEVQVYRFVTKARRLALVGVGHPRRATGEVLQLPRGSYLLVYKHPGCETVRLPISLGRDEEWSLTPPSAEGPRPIRLPRSGELLPGDRYVPASWAVLGGDGEAPGALGRQRLWIDGFVLRDRPVTHGEYLNFLNDLVIKGHHATALSHVPRHCNLGSEGEPIYRWDAVGDRWTLPEDGPEITLGVDTPVVYVTWYDANAYALWVRARTGLPWRLPGELEREKAARGADERTYPWGNLADPAFHCMQDSHLNHPGAPPTESFPVDASPSFVHGLAGGVREWCAELFRPNGPERRGFWSVAPEPLSSADVRTKPRQPQRVVRGGAWNLEARACRAAARMGMDPESRRDNLGFRICRSLS